MIHLRGVSVHNLKGIDLDLPTQKLIVFCGRSGSGKSSLAMDTLCAEGKRRYIETFSMYIRQFLEKLERPDAKRLDGIPPAIAVTAEQSPSPTSTIGTLSEGIDYLRLIFAQFGEAFCPHCGQPIRKQTPQTILQTLQKECGKTDKTYSRLQISFIPELNEDKTVFETIWRHRGFVRGIWNDEIIRFDTEPIPDSCYKDGFQLLVDRVSFSEDSEIDSSRIIDSLEIALEHGDGVCVIRNENTSVGSRKFSTRFGCANCNLIFPPLSPKLFRFLDSNEASLEALSVQIAGKNIVEWTEMSISETKSIIETIFPGNNTFRDNNTNEKIDDNNKSGRIVIQQFCERLNFLEEVGLGSFSLARPTSALREGEMRRARLAAALSSSLVDVLYILDEPSIGLDEESTQKLLICVQKLRDRGNTVLIVTHDEIFLHAADLIVEIGPGAGEEGGNIVFHGTFDEMLSDTKSPTGVFLAAHSSFQKNAKKSDDKKTNHETKNFETKNNKSNENITNKRIYETKKRRTANGTIEWTYINSQMSTMSSISAQKVSLSNSIPLGVLAVVSDSNQNRNQSFILETIYPTLCHHFGKHEKHLTKNGDGDKNAAKISANPLIRLQVSPQLDDVLLVDRTPIGRSPHSIPATYLKLFDDIRAVFAETPDAKSRSWNAGRFSFNTAGGRCERCLGDGFLTIDMQFLADQLVRCPDCHGSRFRSETLDILYRGQSIHDVLKMTVKEAFSFFRGQTKLQQKLKRLIDVGLDYLQLGQPSPTLSGGESQRLKLATYLTQIRKSRTLFILDSPAAGLHFLDILELLDCFDALIETGHSILILEQNRQMV
ncbi:MAG: hypothetical protein ACRCUY_10170, partial [Thermoguttaceae bacterium]